MAVKATPKKRKISVGLTKKKDTEKTNGKTSTNGKIAKAPAPLVLIDYPREGENVLPGHYAVRIAGNQSAPVEVSVNGGEWVGCRASGGYYWFDWWPSQEGKNGLVARARKTGGGYVKTKKRICVLDPNKS